MAGVGELGAEIGGPPEAPAGGLGCGVGGDGEFEAWVGEAIGTDAGGEGAGGEGEICAGRLGIAVVRSFIIKSYTCCTEARVKVVIVTSEVCTMGYPGSVAAVAALYGFP